MGFFGANIVRTARYFEQLELEERLKKLGKFSVAEIDQLYEVTDVPKDEIVDILEVICDPEMSLEEKVADLEEVQSATQILIAMANMERQILSSN